MYVRSLLVFLRHWACGGALVLLSLTVHAGTLTPIRGGETFTLSKVADGSYKLASVTAGGVPVSRAISAGSVMMGAGAVNVLDTFSPVGPTGAQIALGLAREVDWDHVALSAGLGLMATKSAWGSGAAAAYDIWEQLRTKPDGQGGALRDTGTPPPQEVQPCMSTPTPKCYGSISQAVGEAVVRFKAQQDNASVYYSPAGPLTIDAGTGAVGSTWSGVRVLYCYAVDGGQYCGSSNATAGGTYQPSTGNCPVVQDGLSGTVGGGPAGLDGKCPTGRYTAASRAEIAALLNLPEVKPAAQNRAPDFIKDAVNNGVPVEPQSQTISGPAVQQGSPVTTTTTTSTGEQITKIQDQFWNYTYKDGDTIQYTITNTTTTTNNTTNTTTTESTTSTETGNTCKDNPKIAGCLELGDPPDVEKPTKDIPISYTERAFGGASGCPAPYTYSIDISAAGYHKLGELSFQPLCDALAYLRPITLMAAAVTAFFILIGGLKA